MNRIRARSAILLKTCMAASTAALLALSTVFTAIPVPVFADDTSQAEKTEETPVDTSSKMSIPWQVIWLSKEDEENGSPQPETSLKSIELDLCVDKDTPVSESISEFKDKPFTLSVDFNEDQANLDEDSSILGLPKKKPTTQQRYNYTLQVNKSSEEFKAFEKLNYKVYSNTFYYNSSTDKTNEDRLAVVIYQEGAKLTKDIQISLNWSDSGKNRPDFVQVSLKNPLDSSAKIAEFNIKPEEKDAQPDTEQTISAEILKEKKDSTYQPIIYTDKNFKVEFMNKDGEAEDLSESNYSCSVTGDMVNGFVINLEEKKDDTAKTNFSVKAVWFDLKENATKGSKRPDSLPLNLICFKGPDGKNKESTSKLTLLPGENSKWEGNVKDLPSSDGYGTKYTYDIEMDDIPNYIHKIDRDSSGNYTIYLQSTVSGEGAKIPVHFEWDDEKKENRPDTVQIELDDPNAEKGATPPVLSFSKSKESDTQYFSYYPMLEEVKDSKGKKTVQTIDYGIAFSSSNAEEFKRKGYTTKRGSETYKFPDGFNVTMQPSGILTSSRISIPVEVIWLEKDNENKNRPETLTVSLTAYPNGTNTSQLAAVTPVSTAQNITLTGTNGIYKGTFENIPAKDSSGKECVYNLQVPTDKNTVIKDQLYSAYFVEAKGATETSKPYYVVMCDKDTPFDSDIPVRIEWGALKDSSDLPEEVKIQLLKKDSSTKENDESSKKTGTSLVLNKANGWKGEFIDLPAVNENGKVEYSLALEDAEQLRKKGIEFSYSMDPDGTYVLTYKAAGTDGKANLNVKVQWDDNNDADKTRPPMVKINLLKDGTKIDTLTLSEENNWAASFGSRDLEENSEAASTYTLSVDNQAELSALGYTPAITGSATTGFTITLKKTGEASAESTTLSGSIVWDDNTDAAKVRPESLRLNLLSNDTAYQHVDVKAGDQWRFSFEKLPVYDAGGKAITYKLTIDNLDNYTTKYGYSGNASSGFTATLTNTIKARDELKRTIPVSLQWNDNNDRLGQRPSSVTLTLYANGASTGKSVRLSSSNNWTDSFSDLDVYQNGSLVNYSLQPSNVNNYSEKVAGDMQRGFTVTTTHTSLAQTGASGSSGTSTGSSSGTSNNVSTGGTTGSSTTSTNVAPSSVQQDTTTTLGSKTAEETKSEFWIKAMSACVIVLTCLLLYRFKERNFR